MPLPQPAGLRQKPIEAKSMEKEVGNVLMFLRNWFYREEGQGLTEYALLLALIVVIVVAAVAVLGDSIDDLMASVTAALAAAIP